MNKSVSDYPLRKDVQGKEEVKLNYGKYKIKLRNATLGGFVAAILTFRIKCILECSALY